MLEIEATLSLSSRQPSEEESVGNLPGGRMIAVGKELSFKQEKNASFRKFNAGEELSVMTKIISIN